MDRTELVRLASRIKAKTRDVEVLKLYDEVLQGRAAVSTPSANAVSSANTVSSAHANRPKTDRRAYMRDLMRRRRTASQIHFHGNHGPPRNLK